MRYTVMIASIALSASTVAAPVKHHAAGTATPSGPSFSFMGHSPAVVDPNPTGSGGKPCEQSPKSVPGDLTCTDFDATLAGENLNGWISLDYYQGRLYHVFGEGKDAHYPGVLQAFTAKYGEPTMSTATWESKSGATFDNLIATWKFRDGTLHLDHMGLERDDFSFEFYSNANRPPAPPAKVDF